MKTSSKIIASLALLAALAPGAFADQLILSQNGAYSVGNGGAFTATILNGPANSSSYSSLAIDGNGFLTFCIEENEYFNPGGTYNYSLAFGSTGGGVSGQTLPGYDPISMATAWLYSEFAKGTLSVGGFDYSHASLGNLQDAIWFLEGEGGANNAIAQQAQLHEGPMWNNAANGAYGVEVLHLTYLDGGPSQDQLYYHSAAVPDEGLTVALLGLSLVGIAGFRRKFSIAK
jgi:hypothetical protein